MAKNPFSPKDETTTVSEYQELQLIVADAINEADEAAAERFFAAGDTISTKADGYWRRQEESKLLN